MTRKFVLVTFNDNLLTLNHSDKFCKSLLTTSVKDLIVLEDVHAVESSGNSMTFVLPQETRKTYRVCVRVVFMS